LPWFDWLTTALYFSSTRCLIVVRFEDKLAASTPAQVTLRPTPPPHMALKRIQKVWIRTTWLISRKSRTLDETLRPLAVLVLLATIVRSSNN
jgi:hypothetical protein